MRIGFGYDSHRFETDPSVIRPQKLGGAVVPECPPLRGHSDADVLVHAIVDALLGAAALGDIGALFPDTDPRWKGADSAVFLQTVCARIRAAGYEIGNLDATVICERPRLRPHVEAIRASLAELMNVPVSAVSVKGKTNERMDDLGAGLGIAVHCAALLAAP